jgi:hypothetical protein
MMRPCSARSEEKAMSYRIPQPMKAEHEELHAELAKATKAGGRTGQAAQAVARVMHTHFQKEEEYALPPLGILADLAKGKIDPGMSEILKMTDKLETELPTMLSEHKEIVAALKTLIDAAKAEDKPEYVYFAEKLMAHARMEEEVSYPTALLIGRYLKTVRTARSR